MADFGGEFNLADPEYGGGGSQTPSPLPVSLLGSVVGPHATVSFDLGVSFSCLTPQCGGGGLAGRLPPVEATYPQEAPSVGLGCPNSLFGDSLETLQPL